MSLTRKASSAAKKPAKPPRQDLAAALAEREAELAEARSQQAATAEILRVISQSPTDAAPVFEAILDAGQRLFGYGRDRRLIRSATTTWCGWRRGAARGPRKSGATSPRSPKA